MIRQQSGYSTRLLTNGLWMPKEKQAPMLRLEIHLLKQLSLHLVVSLHLQVIDLVSRTKSALDLQYTDEDSESNFNCKSIETPAPKNKDRVSNLQIPASQLASQ